MSTRRDANQVIKYEHDETANAKRVVLVGGEKLDITVDSDKISQSIKESLENLEIKMPEITTLNRNSEIKTVEVPVIIPEVKIVEIDKPIITKEVQVIEVEKPVIIKETTVEKIEIPVITKEIEYKLHPAYMIIMSLLSISLLGCILKIQGVINV